MKMIDLIILVLPLCEVELLPPRAARALCCKESASDVVRRSAAASASAPLPST